MLREIILYQWHGYNPDHIPVPPFPSGFPTKMLIYNWFARAHNWGPEIVDNLTLEQLEWFPIMDDAITAATEIIQKEQQAQNKANRW